MMLWVRGGSSSRWSQCSWLEKDGTTSGHRLQVGVTPAPTREFLLGEAWIDLRTPSPGRGGSGSDSRTCGMSGLVGYVCGYAFSGDAPVPVNVFILILFNGWGEEFLLGTEHRP